MARDVPALFVVDKGLKMRRIRITVFLLIAFACSSCDSSTNKAESAQQWLLSNMKRFFTENATKDDTVMFTKKYLRYKHDAIGREFDGLTDGQFAKKWKGKYNTKFAGTGSILIGQQDWIHPKVTHCELKQKTDDAFIFNVIIEDSDDYGKYIHKRDIKVIPRGKTFIIDDILEYEN